MKYSKFIMFMIFLAVASTTFGDCGCGCGKKDGPVVVSEDGKDKMDHDEDKD